MHREIIASLADGRRRFRVIAAEIRITHSIVHATPDQSEDHLKARESKKMHTEFQETVSQSISSLSVEDVSDRFIIVPFLTTASCRSSIMSYWDRHEPRAYVAVFLSCVSAIDLERTGFEIIKYIVTPGSIQDARFKLAKYM